MNGLPDYLDYHMKILFVGYNPGERSADLGHHYAGRGNQFWRLLCDAGFTDRLYRPEEDSRLLAEGYGLTNLVGRPSKSSADLSPGEMREGAVDLRKKVERYRPGLVCFLGKDVYRKYAGLKSTEKIDYGPVPTTGGPEGVKGFLAPNPSARSTIPYAEKLSLFQALKEMVLPRC